MSHIHWVPRQNKLETPKDKDDVNKQDIHESDGRSHDSDTMVVPLTPKPKRSREEEAALRKLPKPRSRCANCILETKTQKPKSEARIRTRASVYY
jgi:hypothetical protein